jgi:DNA-binding HxlR family transcriptional regulator
MLVMPQAFKEAVRWLLERGNRREREVLDHLRNGPRTAGEIKSALSIAHDPQIHRALEALDDQGLLDRHYDTSKTKRGQVYSASPLGIRALELADRVDSFIDEHAGRARA